MSVCIVHRDGWAVCDSREMAGNCILPVTAKKIVKSDGFLFSSVGDRLLHQNIEKIVSEQGHDTAVIDSIVKHMEEKNYDNSCVLAVSYKREIIDIGGDGACSTLDTDFWAIGCCDQFVLGHLFVIAETREVTIDDAVAAIKAAARYDSGIDDRVQIFHLNTVI